MKAFFSKFRGAGVEQSKMTEGFYSHVMGDRFHERLSRVLLCGVFGSLCKIFVYSMYDFQTQNVETMQRLIDEREPRRALLTVSNHSSTLDDPLLWSALPFRTLWNIDKMRWTLAAEEVCFGTSFAQWFFGSGHGMSVRRGAGLKQPGVEHAIRKLQEGQWVHIFPEGRVFQEGKIQQRLKWGVGKCLARTVATLPSGVKPPLVLPFYHTGMEKVVPLSRFDESVGYPTMFEKIPIRFLVGDPFCPQEIVESFIEKARREALAKGLPFDRATLFIEDTPDEKNLYSLLTAEITEHIRNLETRLQYSPNFK